jgi:hypothetical protein
VFTSAANEGVNIPPRGQISPLGDRGEVKNGPQAPEVSYSNWLLGTFNPPGIIGSSPEESLVSVLFPRGEQRVVCSPLGVNKGLSVRP